MDFSGYQPTPPTLYRIVHGTGNPPPPPDKMATRLGNAAAERDNDPAMSTNQNSPLAEELDTRAAPEGPPRFQFSLFSMFVVTTAVAATCSLTFTMPAVAAIPLFGVFSMVLTAVLITGIIYGRGYQRTFCIGAVVPFGVLLFALGFAAVIFFLPTFPEATISCSA